MSGWGDLVKHYRLRHGLSQADMAELMGVAQRTVSRWERGEDNPSLGQQKRLRDLGWEPSGSLLGRLAASIGFCPAPRALTRSARLTLQALSPAALAKRPSLADRIGKDLVDLATGVLREMLDDRSLQRSILRREVVGVTAVTRSVLATSEAGRIGAFRSTVTYFFHEGTLYSDAIAQPAGDDETCGYTVLPMDMTELDLPPPARLPPRQVPGQRRRPGLPTG